MGGMVPFAAGCAPFLLSTPLALSPYAALMPAGARASVARFATDPPGVPGDAPPLESKDAPSAVTAADPVAAAVGMVAHCNGPAVVGAEAVRAEGASNWGSVAVVLPRAGAGGGAVAGVDVPAAIRSLPLVVAATSTSALNCYTAKASPSPPTTTAACTTANTTAASSPSPAAAAAASTSALAFRFRTGRRKMTAIERAAATAHDALSAATAAAVVRQPRSAVIAASAPPGPLGAYLGQRVQSPSDNVAVNRDMAADLDLGLGEMEADADADAQREAVEQRRRFVGLKNETEKARSRAARRLDCFMKELSVPLSRYLAGFPPPGRLHPFEGALLALTVGEGNYKAALQRVDRLRRAVQVGKGAASRAGSAPNRAAATALSEEGVQALETVFTAGARHVDDLKEIAKKLRSLPSLDTSLPTLALVGAPNVGKSSLVNILSSGTPEVCNYPFTTRSIKMGHFYLDAQKHQVTDTPGLLRRPDSLRNRMELLTLAALGCLDAVVVYVVDLTEECGTSLSDQWAIRKCVPEHAKTGTRPPAFAHHRGLVCVYACREVRQRFPDRPWIDVLSKADMLQGTFAVADERIRQQRRDASDTAAAASTAVDDADGMYGSVNGDGAPGTKAPALVTATTETEMDGPEDLSAVEFTVRLPYASQHPQVAEAVEGSPEMQQGGQGQGTTRLVTFFTS
ncbi:hypothetical protein VOLCADRAFT_95251 [Volvox carteri f. nagariensis]|uniref:OBG-type G domain-containing protein n=1 Tax=Volvox carteri f. nagariensis TaxID=3068 RepID=D8U704_VOLCA|nr:uncharacterized protein VOLCADRAFT_95251 [Volvox carteri f. nagariensis]EFJ44602.1 hypothetical protein VOLCADRAFT_95251 [Volvox carteri f. nagariensis]|eukprot:XP_002954452.1 hypothetical protein VOLCADRAFT_95251 [Volvox carteri f. nagariensis]